MKLLALGVLLGLLIALGVVFGHRGEVPVQGTTRSEPVALKLGFAGAEADDFGYAIDIGLPPPVPSTAFSHDPQIKHEAIWSGPLLRPSTQLVDRKGAALRLREGKGWQAVGRPIPAFASMMTEHADPRDAPEMLTLREQMRSWRFYDHFRSDAEAPARQPQLGTYTPVLANDGADLAAALQTIREIVDGDALDRAVDDAFPGAGIEIRVNGDGHTARACITLAVQADGAAVTTAEGLAPDGQLTPVQQGFWEKHGMQCGFCTPGFLMVVTELLDENPDPSDDEIRDALGANLCRCTGYTKIVEAVHEAVRLAGAAR